jgi:hypothetical protein
MTTIINNPNKETEARGSDSNAGVIAVLLVLIVAGILFYLYGVPGRDTGGVNVTVPESVDVNVRTPDVTPGGGNTEGGGAE